MAAKYDCIHEELIQDHSVQIRGLETRADYKDKRIDELYDKIDKMEEKIDALNKNVNKLVLQSAQDDKGLELRVTQLETDMKNRDRESDRKVVWIGIALTIITILINLYFNMIH